MTDKTQAELIGVDVTFAKVLAGLGYTLTAERRRLLWARHGLELKQAYTRDLDETGEATEFGHLDACLLERVEFRPKRT